MNTKTKKYKGVFQDKNGKFFFQTELGIDLITGKRIQKKARKDKFGKSFESAKEAYDEMLRVKNEFNQLHSHDNYHMTFEQYMNDVYLIAYKQKVQSITYTTVMGQHNDFIARFGKKKLRDITTRDCELYRLNLLDRFSPNYARNVWSRLKACLSYAERLGYLSEFPCKNLDNPKGKHPDTKFWRKEEFLEVIDTFDLTDYQEMMRYALTWCCFIWGTRVGEILALKWGDLSFDKKFVHIHATLERGEMGLFAKEGTKTSESTRMIECDEITLAILKRWKSIQIYSKSENFIFSYYGKPLDKSTFTRVLKRHAKLANVPEITGKGLRHSNNTYLRRELGKSSELVSMRSGRKATSKVTDDTYTHFYKLKSDNVADELVTELLKVALPNNLPKVNL